MKRYFKLLLALFKISAIADLEYRLNIVLKVFTDFLWYAAQISVFEVLFSHSKNISGWTIETTRVFLGVLFVVDAVYMIFFHENLDKLNEKVRKGDLDLLLAKPVNSQFMLTMQKVNTPYIINFFFVSGFLAWTLLQLPEGIPSHRLWILIFAIPSSVLVIYSLRFFFSATAVIFVRAENIVYVWYQLYRLGTRPDSIFPNWIRYPILFILPLGLIASIPTQLLTQEASLLWIPWMIFIACFFVYLSHRFWNYVLKKYSSASS